MNIAAIDIGTNTVRVLIRDAQTGAVVVKESAITRLGEGVNAHRALQPAAMARTLDALRGFAGQCVAHDVGRLRVVATSATRDAENRDAFLAEVAFIVGTVPEVITGDEEARLAFAGVVSGTAPEVHPAPYLVVDIGGGSTELIVGTDAPSAAVSLDVGSVRMTEMFLASDPPLPEELSNAVGYVRDLLADTDRILPSAHAARTTFGVAGTTLTAAAVDLVLDPYDPARTHGYVLTRAAAESVFRELATATREERLDTPGLEPERADVIVGGLVVLVSILRHYDLAEIVCSETDILDGLAQILAKSTA